MNEVQKIRSFTDLVAWQNAHEVLLHVYKITKAFFPAEEMYALTNQLRRAAISMTSNIAEGFSRRSLKEKIQFYHIALGSNTEIQNQLMIAHDLKYIDEKVFILISKEIVIVNKLINGLIKSLRKV